MIAAPLDYRASPAAPGVPLADLGEGMNDAACDRTGQMFAGTKAEDDTPVARLAVPARTRSSGDHDADGRDCAGLRPGDRRGREPASLRRAAERESCAGRPGGGRRRGCACSSCDELCVRRPVPGGAVHHDGCRAWQSHRRGRLVCVQARPYRHASQSLPGLNAPGYAEVEVAHKGLSA